MCDRWNDKTNRIKIFYLKSKYVKKYCGDKKKLPSGYDRKGTRFECLKTGMFISELKTCKIRTVTKKDLPKLKKKELILVCKQLKIKYNNKITKVELIKKIQQKDTTKLKNLHKSKINSRKFHSRKYKNMNDKKIQKNKSIRRGKKK